MSLRYLFSGIILLFFLVFSGCDPNPDPGGQPLTLELLAEQLAAAANTDAEKAKVIWDWITDNISYDVESYFAGTTGATSAEDTLTNGSSVCAGYANLYKALADRLGLQAEVVSGYAKGYSYTEGYVFPDTNHAWNAVHIDGTWHLLDSTWGAGYVDNAHNFVKRLDTGWYLTDPEHFIFSHLPELASWQLVDTPVTKQRFEELPDVDPAFFAWGFTPAQVYAEVDGANYRGLVTRYNLSTPRSDITIVQAPVGRYLKAGDPCSFIVRIPSSLAVSFYCPSPVTWYFCADGNNDLPPYGSPSNYTGQNVGTKSADGTYTFNFTPQAGELMLADMYNTGGQSQFLLKYLVE